MPEGLSCRIHNAREVIVMDGIREILRFQAIRAAHLVLGAVFAEFAWAHVISRVVLNPG